MTTTPKAKAPRKPRATKAAEQPEVTLEGLTQQAEAGAENAKAGLYKQLGVKEFLESLKKEGYTIVKVGAEGKPV